MSEWYDRSTFFGLSRVVEAGFRLELEDFLVAAWRAQYMQDPAGLADDLDRLKSLFRPRASGAGLREAAAALSDLRLSQPEGLPESFFLEIDAHHGFVTAEGRLALDLIALRAPGRLLIEDSDLFAASLRLSEFYGTPARAAVLSAVAQPDLRPLSFAFALFLLLNGSVGEEHALRSPTTADEQRRLMNALGPALDTFSRAIGGKPFSAKEGARMEGNWALTEVARQLPTLYARTAGGYWVQPGGADSTPRRLGQLLQRRKNAPSEAALSKGLTALEVAYREARPALAALGLAYDRPGRTRSVIADVLAGFREEAGAPS